MTLRIYRLELLPQDLGFGYRGLFDAANTTEKRRVSSGLNALIIYSIEPFTCPDVSSLRIVGFSKRIERPPIS